SPASVFCVGPAPPLAYTLSLHDALPIWATTRQRRISTRWCDLRPFCSSRYLPCSAELAVRRLSASSTAPLQRKPPPSRVRRASLDRKSTRLNSSHVKISYAVFCLKKKKL